jgi:hypothetical protein
MGPNFWGKQVSFQKKSRATRHRQQPSINKVTIVGPRTSQQSDTALTIHFAKWIFNRPGPFRLPFFFSNG